jgi:hypothetical protein
MSIPQETLCTRCKPFLTTSVAALAGFGLAGIVNRIHPLLRCAGMIIEMPLEPRKLKEPFFTTDNTVQHSPNQNPNQRVHSRSPFGDHPRQRGTEDIEIKGLKCLSGQKSLQRS